MHLESLVQLIMNRLKRRESLDLVVLEALLNRMTGESRVQNDGITAMQCESYAGGREVIRENLDVTAIMIFKKNQAGDGAVPRTPPIDKGRLVRKSYPKLLKTLRDTGMMLPIWIALAQTSLDVVDRMANTPIKAISNMQDSVSS